MIDQVDSITAAHLRALEDEEIGVAYRIKNFYLPFFRQFTVQRKLCPADVRILDCGCGNGASVEYLAESGFWATGIDLAQARCEQWGGRAQLPRVALLRADAGHLPFANCTFDIVLSSGMLEHIGVAEECTPQYRVSPLPEQNTLRRNFIAECMRVLRPGGIVYIDHPNGRFPVDFWHNDFRSRPRFDSPREKFLPSFSEVARIAIAIDPHCMIQAISPAGRFTFRRSRRRWYGVCLEGAMRWYLNLLRNKPFSVLAKTPLNPYLVIRA